MQVIKYKKNGEINDDKRRKITKYCRKLGYGLGRAWIEGLRTDQLQIGMTGIPVSQMLACILVIFSAVTILWGRSNAKRKEQAKTNE